MTIFKTAANKKYIPVVLVDIKIEKVAYTCARWIKTWLDQVSYKIY